MIDAAMSRAVAMWYDRPRSIAIRWDARSSLSVSHERRRPHLEVLHRATTVSGRASAGTESLHGRALTASLTVRDLLASLDWYRDVLGFAVESMHEREGRLLAVTLRAGEVRILIGQDDGSKGADRVKGEGFSLMITTAQNIDDVATRIRAHGGMLDSEPADTPWGMRAFRLRDPDGFKLVISSGH